MDGPSEMPKLAELRELQAKKKRIENEIEGLQESIRVADEFLDNERSELTPERILDILRAAQDANKKLEVKKSELGTVKELIKIAKDALLGTPPPRFR